MKGLASVLGPVCLCAGLVSCGSDLAVGDPASWVDDVCARMTVVDRQVSTQKADFDSLVSGQADPRLLLVSLEHFLGEVSAVVVPAAADIDNLGDPPISAGPQVRRDVKGLFDTVIGEVASLETAVRQAASDSGETMHQADALMAEANGLTDLDTELRAILTDQRQLRPSFDSSSSCTRWVKQLDSAPETTAAPTTAAPATTLPPTTLPATTLPPTTLPAPTVPATTTPTTTTPATTVPATTVPVTVDPYIAVREQYLVAADEYNPKFDEVWNSFHDADGYILYKDAPTYCGQVATLEREWVDRMNAIPWPPDALDEAQAQSAESAVLLNLLDQCAAAPATRGGQDALLDALAIEDETYYAAVDALRIAIGLPPINGG